MATKLGESLGSAAEFDHIVAGGGGLEVLLLLALVQEKLKQAQGVPHGAREGRRAGATTSGWAGTAMSASPTSVRLSVELRALIEQVGLLDQAADRSAALRALLLGANLTPEAIATFQVIYVIVANAVPSEIARRTIEDGAGTQPIAMSWRNRSRSRLNMESSFEPYYGRTDRRRDIVCHRIIVIA
jgi:hypothetical protein